MKKLIFLFTVINFLGLPSFGQNFDCLWAKSTKYGGFSTYVSLATDLFGNTYMTGDFHGDSILFDTLILRNKGYRDIFLAKYNVNGDVMWAKSIAGIDQDYARSISVDETGNIYITGTFKYSTLFLDSITLKSSGQTDIFLAKYNSKGKVMWAKNLGGEYDDYIHSVSTDGSGNIYVVGEFKSKSFKLDSITLSNNGMEDIFLAKYDLNGNIQWAKKAGGGSKDYALSVANDNKGNIYFTGGFRSQFLTFGSTTLTNMNEYDNVFITKFDSNGNAIWAKSAGGPGKEWANSIAVNSSGNIYITGHFGSSTIQFGTNTLMNTGNVSIFLTAYDPNGNVVWARSASGDGFNESNSVSTDLIGNVYITGYYNSSTITFSSISLTNQNTAQDNFFLAKYDKNGTLIWAKSNDTAETFSVKLDVLGNIYVAGTFWGSTINFGSTLLTTTNGGDTFIAKLSKSLSLKDNPILFNDISIYPVPVRDKLNVEIPQKSIIEIINDKGRIIKTLDFYGGQTIIDLENFKNGVYILRAQSKNEIVIKKFIKQ